MNKTVNETVIFRNHFFYVVKNSSGLLVVLLLIFLNDPQEMGMLIGEMLSNPDVRIPVLLGLLAFFLIIGIIVFFQIRRWRRTYIEIDETNMTLHRATLVRKDYVIAMQNISSINQEQTLVQKIFGVYTMKIDTNTTATADETDISIILNRKKSVEFREVIDERLRMVANAASTATTATTANTSSAANTDNPGASVTDPYNHLDVVFENPEIAGLGWEALSEDNCDISYSAGETVKHSILSTGFAGLLLAIAAIGVAVIVADEIELSSNGLMDLLLAAIAVIVAVWSIVGAAVKKYLLYYNFRAKRDGDYILLQYGLTTTRRFRLPVDKINTVYVKQSGLARIFKLYEVHISAIGLGDGDDEIKNVLLYGNRSETRENLMKLLPEFGGYFDGNMEKKEIRARLIDLVQGVIIDIIVIAFLAAFVPVKLAYIGIAGIIGILLTEAILVLRNNTAGIYIGDSGIKVRTGTFGATESLVGYDKIQTVKYEAGPILRRFGLAKTTLTLFGGTFDLVIIIDSFKREFSEQIAEKTVEAECFK